MRHSGLVRSQADETGFRNQKAETRQRSSVGTQDLDTILLTLRVLLQVPFRSAAIIRKPRKQKTLLQALEWWRSCFEPFRVVHLG
jgi:hypothetical protein